MNAIGVLSNRCRCYAVRILKLAGIDAALGHTEDLLCLLETIILVKPDWRSVKDKTSYAGIDSSVIES